MVVAGRFVPVIRLSGAAETTESSDPRTASEVAIMNGNYSAVQRATNMKDGDIRWNEEWYLVVQIDAKGSRCTLCRRSGYILW